MMNDTLSDVLRAIRLRGAVFYHLNFGAEWAVEGPPACQIADFVLPGAEHVMEYHVMTKGTGWAVVDGLPPLRLETGDVVILPHGDGHVISSAPGLRALCLSREWVQETRNAPKPIPIVFHSLKEFSCEVPESEALNNVVCGFLGCDKRPFGPLLAILPRILHIPANEGASWIAPVMREAIEASQRSQPGCNAVLERIGEMVFVDGVKRYVEHQPSECSGWLAGVRDRQLGKALALIHRAPERAWTIEALACEAGLSRSVFYERFERLLGQSPKLYLTRWRIELATSLLLRSKAPVASIALDVGYESEAAFARAFKRLIGEPPARWRKLQAVG